MKPCKMIEHYLERRGGFFSKHTSRYDFGFEDKENLGAYADNWHCFTSSGNLYFVLELRLDKSSSASVSERWEKVKDKISSNVNCMYTDFQVLGIYQERPLILALSKQKIDDDASDWLELDTTLIQVAHAAFLLSAFFNNQNAKSRSYKLSELNSFCRFLGYRLSFTGLEPKCEPINNKEGEKSESGIDKALKLDTKKDDGIWLKSTGVTFDDVAGMDDQKELVKRQIIWPMKHRDAVQQYKLKLSSGLLLYGPPGTGKTYFAKALATEAGCGFRMIKASDLGSPFIHETSRRIVELFSEARKRAPVLLVFDEVDQWLPQRGSQEAEKKNDEISTLLSETCECANDGVFIVGTTNRREDIDPAFTRHGRMDLQIRVDPPDKEGLQRLFEHELKGRPQEEIDLEKLAEMSAGLVPADISYIVNSGALEAAISGARISQKFLEEKIAECVRPKKEVQRRIGFRTGSGSI